MRNALLVTVLLAGIAASPVQAETVDLSDVTEKFARNMRFLETLTPEAALREQMSVVREQAEDLGQFFRANGTASRRRKLFEEQEKIKSQPKLSKRDMEDLQELRREIKELDPENYFSRARSMFNESVSELRKELDFIQTNDPVREDIIRLIRQHLAVYNQALQEY